MLAQSEPPPSALDAAGASAGAGSRSPPHPRSTARASLLSVEQARKDKTSLSYILRSGLAGGLAGCAAKTSVAPLDRIKILFQARNPEFAAYAGHITGVVYAARDIVRRQGAGALFQGHSATLLRIFPYAAIKYMAYDKLHFLIMPTKDKETSVRLFAAGSTSGVLSVFCTYPLELIRVRLAFETKRHQRRGDLLRIIRTIYSEGSTAAPFSGDVRKRGAGGAPRSHASSVDTLRHVPSQPLPPSGQMAASAATSLSNGALIAGAEEAQQALHAQSAQQHAQHAHHTPMTVPSTSASASISAFAPTSSQTSAPVSASTTASTSASAPKTIATSQRMLNHFPILRFYRGFSVTLMGMIPYAGTAFLVFGRTKNVLHAHFAPEKRRRYQPSKTVLDLAAGSVAGAISQTAAYPFEVIRRCQQIGGKTRPDSLVGIVETATWIYRSSGVRGFYVGLSIGLLKVMPMTAVSFSTWLAMKRQMGI